MLNNNLYAEGGMNQQGGTTDPVSGNDVPAGALQKEVRDDIPAKLSEGEFVIPADVVRYIGLDRLMQLRDKAKEGLARMEEIGQMGNAEQASSPEEPHGDEFAAEIDSIMGELDSEGEKNNLAIGGMPATNTGFQVKQFKKPDGSSMFVTFINGAPATQIPEGAQEITAANQAQKDQAALTPTEKSVSNKSNMGTMAQVLTNTPDESRKMLNKAMMDKALEIKATRETKDAINKNIEFDPNAFTKTIDSELTNYSDAADYRLTDGMENYMLSNSMDQAAAPASAPLPTGLDTMPDMSGLSTEMPMVMAKGGLVARRKK
jgi:hypothetical protein